MRTLEGWVLHILVTGGAGYIGSHVVKQLLEKTSYRITILDNLSTGHCETVNALKALADDESRLNFVEAELSDMSMLEPLFVESRYDAVMHFAASIVVPESVRDPLKYYMNNTLNTALLVKLCVKHGIGKFIFSSTAAVYGEPTQIPVNETQPAKPINPYGTSKWMCEQIIQDSAAVYEDFNYVILRYFNVAGSDEKNRIGQSFPNATHLIKVAAQTATRQRSCIYIYGDDYDTFDGTCIRDYIHVDDLASAHLSALKYLDKDHGTEIEPNVFNVGYGHGFSVYEVIQMMKRVSGVDFAVEPASRREGDPETLVADNARILKNFDWVPEHDSLEAICKTALAWETRLSEARL